VALLGLALLSGPAQAATVFGDIIINVKSEPRGSPAHGYLEYVFLLSNQSTERAHTVTLVLPYEASWVGRTDHIRAVSRTVRVEPRTMLQVALLHPDYPPVFGSGLRVRIDGREQEEMVPVSIGRGSGMKGGGYYGVRGGPRIFSPTGTPVSNTLILVSQRVGERFQVTSPSISMTGWEPGKGMPLMFRLPRADVVRAEEPVNSWSPRWLSYSHYDGVVLTRDELEALARGPADSQAIRTALLQYVEAGGTLLVVGGSGAETPPLTLPASWKRNHESRNGLRTSYGGFGLCLQIDNRDTSTWDISTASEISNAWARTAAPYLAQHDLLSANNALPIVEDVGLPVRSLFVLMLLFTLVIGPCNIWLLARWKRRIWLLWTAPLISLVTCTAVFGCMIFAEGWQGRTRVAAFTVLDETEQRATTLGHSASYSPLTPGDGLHFSPDTEVTVLGSQGPFSSQSACDLDWTKDQHLQRGWIAARVPAHFQLRRSDTKRLERLVVSREKDGSLQITNQLGAAIRKLWLADEKGRLYTGDAVQVGQTGTLKPTATSLPAAGSKGALRGLYEVAEWAGLGQTAAAAPNNYLTRRSYLAVIESSPFMESGLGGAVVRPTASYVLGLMAEE
jgi:hypothetical protein